MKRVTVKLPKETHYKLKVLAAEQELTLDIVMNRAAEMYLQHNCKTS